MSENGVVEPCPECGTPGDIGNGYGSYHAFECPDCGHEWVVDGTRTTGVDHE